MDEGNVAIIATATRGSTRNFALGINMIMARLIGFNAFIRAKSLSSLCFSIVSRLFRGTIKWFQSAGELARSAYAAGPLTAALSAALSYPQPVGLRSLGRPR
jgi:hypothetical protein